MQKPFGHEKRIFLIFYFDILKISIRQGDLQDILVTISDPFNVAVRESRGRGRNTVRRSQSALTKMSRASFTFSAIEIRIFFVRMWTVASRVFQQRGEVLWTLLLALMLLLLLLYHSCLQYSVIFPTFRHVVLCAKLLRLNVRTRVAPCWRRRLTCRSGWWARWPQTGWRSWRWSAAPSWIWEVPGLCSESSPGTRPGGPWRRHLLVGGNTAAGAAACRRATAPGRSSRCSPEGRWRLMTQSEEKTQMKWKILLIISINPFTFS